MATDRLQILPTELDGGLSGILLPAKQGAEWATINDLVMRMKPGTFKDHLVDVLAVHYVDEMKGAEQ